MRLWKYQQPDTIAASLRAADEPHPTDLLRLRNVLEPYADLYVVALWRNFLSTVNSHSPGQDGGLREHGRVMAGFVQWLSGDVLPRLPRDRWRVLCVDALDTEARSALPLIGHRRSHATQHGTPHRVLPA